MILWEIKLFSCFFFLPVKRSLKRSIPSLWEAKIREAKMSLELSPHPQRMPDNWIIHEFICWERKFRSKKCWNWKVFSRTQLKCHPWRAVRLIVKIWQKIKEKLHPSPLSLWVHLISFYCLGRVWECLVDSENPLSINIIEISEV